MTKQITATRVNPKTAFKHGITGNELVDYGYKMIANKFGSFDLIDESGETLLGAAMVARMQCSECGNFVYEVYFCESDYSGFECCGTYQEWENLNWKHVDQSKREN